MARLLFFSSHNFSSRSKGNGHSLARLSVKATLLLFVFFMMMPALLKAQVKARRANDFIETIGVNTHLGYTDSKYYTQYETIKARLAELKVRHIRDGVRLRWSHKNTVRDRYLDLYNTLGISVLFVGGVKDTADVLDASRIHEELDFLAPAAQAIYSVEGPNEYLKNSATETWPTILKNYQMHLYEQLKAHPTLSKAKRVGPSLIAGNMSQAPDMSAYCDYGNLHLYLTHPGGDAGGRTPVKYTKILTEYDRIFGANKPGVISESGFHNAITSSGYRHWSYRVSAKVVPRQFTQYFVDNRDWPVVSNYEFIDIRNNEAYAEDNWGLLHRDLTPKPAYHSLKNLIHLLHDMDATFTPATLNYSLSGDTTDVRHLLLQKGDGKFYLCTWLELPKTASYNSTTGVELDPTRSLTLNFSSSIATMKRYEPCHPDSLETGTTAKQTYTNPTSMGITVHDWVSVYEIELSQVKSFTLINTDTQQPVTGFDPIPDNAVIDFTQLGTTKLNIRANTLPDTVGQVVFDYDGTAGYFTDSAFPYALAGDASGQYLSWTPALGEHTLTATPYAGTTATGSAGSSSTLHFTVINSVQNLAVGKPVTATSGQETHPAALAVDDDVTTRWVAQKWPVWLEVDLGKVYSIEKTQLVTYQNRSYQYKIEVSTDQLHYQHLNKTTASGEEGVFTDRFTPLAARYVRVKLLEDQGDRTGKDKDGWVSLSEFRVFGKTMLAPSQEPAPKGGAEKVADFFSRCSLYPNPAKTTVRVEYAARQAGAVHVWLLAVSRPGQPCLKQVYQAQAGTNAFLLDVHALPAGMYLVHLIGNQQQVIKKLLIMN